MSHESRVLALWCPDWPAVAASAEAGVAAHQPVAVLLSNRVMACSATARMQGVRRGVRRREAQARCPELYVCVADEDRDARRFESVAAAVDAIVPGAEIVRPGLLVLPARGVARYLGGEEAAAERLIDAIAGTGVECQAGIADQIFTAVLAARHGQVVPGGRDAEYLAPFPVSELAVEPGLAAVERAELTGLLTRLGLRTIGDFAAVEARYVASRFGTDAISAHRRARGEPDRPPSGRALPPDLEVAQRCDPPIERVDMAAFAGRALAVQLHEKLAGANVACTRLRVHARTENGEEHARVWRCAEPLTPEGTADRVRWQLDGWLTGHHQSSPTAGITWLRLEPVEVVSSGALQLGLWGGVGEDEERARRALIRVQGLLGGDAVRIGVQSGGRGTAERVTLIPLGDEQVPASDPAAPWPGKLPEPAPSEVYDPAPEVALLDERRREVLVTGRGILTAEPHTLMWDKDECSIEAWAGPWCVDENWWDAGSAQRAARLEILTENRGALLVKCTAGIWNVEGRWG
ncbi:DNA polymerase Y family protein [Hoyosella subflava]|uniref:UmuC domain-containing protein n=1 Tax=Hoyosella subflava (strain DSM 45089 / JCM 17490 / NBRC 109087 / DQS3-9A1) TaxID=443218 RepID=F6EIF8_HOYSD|nr:DNA polymerase Y family protein [Hoyosella subflava]AEF42450.1 hypothetical protein AS9A_4016 [Hoyosella subflava DQS3-9A1]